MRVAQKEDDDLDALDKIEMDELDQTDQENSPDPEPVESQIQYYNIDEGTNTLYGASENADGTWTVTHPQGESIVISAVDFHMTYMEYQAPLETDPLEPEGRLVDLSPDIEPDPGHAQADNSDDLDQAKARNRELEERILNQQQGQGVQGQGVVPIGTSEQKIATAAERLITGLSALGTGVFKGVGKVVGNTVDQLTSWQGQQRLLEIQSHVDSVNNHLDTIKSDPDFVNEIKAIETGIKSKDDVQSSLYERFTNTDPEVATSNLNRAYHSMIVEMTGLANLDLESAIKDIDLKKGVQADLTRDVSRSFSNLLEREELDVLPDANNENIRKSVEEIVKRIQEIFQKLVQKFTNQAHPQEDSGMAPS